MIQNMIEKIEFFPNIEFVKQFQRLAKMFLIKLSIIY